MVAKKFNGCYGRIFVAMITNILSIGVYMVTQPKPALASVENLVMVYKEINDC